MLKLIGFEMKKMWSHKYLIPVVVVLIALVLFPVLRMYSHNKEFVDKEREFYAKYGGVLTEQSHMEITDMVNADDINTYDENGNLLGVDVGFIVADYAMRDISYMISYKNTQESIVSKAQENAQFYKERGYNYLSKLNEQIADKYSSYSQPWLISSGDWEMCLTNFYYTVLGIILVMLLTSNVFTRESESKMDSVIRSSYSGTKAVFVSKIVAVAISSFEVMLFFAIVNFIAQYATTCLYGMDAPFKSISSFGYSSLDMKIWQVLLLFVLLTCVAAMLFGVLFALISSFCKRSFLSMVISLAVLSVTFLAYYFMNAYGQILFHIDMGSAEITEFLNTVRGYAFPMLLDISKYFDNYYTISVFSYPVPTVISSLTIGVIAIGLIMAIAFAKYTGAFHKVRWGYGKA